MGPCLTALLTVLFTTILLTLLTTGAAVFTVTFSGDSAEPLTSTEESLMRQSPSLGRRAREFVAVDSPPPPELVGA